MTRPYSTVPERLREAARLLWDRDAAALVHEAAERAAEAQGRELPSR